MKLHLFFLGMKLHFSLTHLIAENAT